MPDTAEARKAIRHAYDCHRDVMGDMSMAMVKLEAAGGLYRNDDDLQLPYPEDSPVWTEHAQIGLRHALARCEALREALIAAAGEVAKLEEHGDA